MRLLRNPMNGFKYAIEGLVHVFRTQRHMRFHFLTLVLVLVVSLVFKLAREEVIILLFTISLVLMAEMFTAIEAVVDLVTQTYHPPRQVREGYRGRGGSDRCNKRARGWFFADTGGERLKRIGADIGSACPKLAGL